MSEAETETDGDTETDTEDDPIVLEAPYGLASVGAVPKSAEGEGETDPEDDPELGNGIREISSPSPDPEPADPSRVIDLPQPESARGGTQEFEVQDVAFARGLLTENKRVTLVENPTDADLSGLLTRKQKARGTARKSTERNSGTKGRTSTRARTRTIPKIPSNRRSRRRTRILPLPARTSPLPNCAGSPIRRSKRRSCRA